jgi:Recombinase zinc beta ribbon domain
LRCVAEVYQRRSFKQADHGVNRETYPYPLAGLCYCAHCDQLARREHTPTQRTTLGSIGYPRPRAYRHSRRGVKCGCSNRSVPAAVIEGEVGHLLALLTVRTEALKALADLAAQIHGRQETLDLEHEKARAIARCQEKIKRAQELYVELELDKAAYEAVLTENRREIVRWQHRTAEVTRLYLQLEKCAMAIETLNAVWTSSNDAERQAMVRSLFEEIVVNLDTHRIEGFKLKAWADEFLTLRAALYEIEENTTRQPKNRSGSVPKFGPK